MKLFHALAALFKASPAGKFITVVVSLVTIGGAIATFMANATGTLGLIAPSLFGEPAPLSADQQALLRRELRRAFAEHDLSESALPQLSQTLVARHSLDAELVDRWLAKWSPALRLSGESLARGFRLVSAGQVDQAQQEFLSATRSDPGDPRAWSNLGGCYALQKRYSAAREAYDRALALDPADSATRYNFGLLLARMGSSRESMPQLRQALTEMRRRPAQSALLQQVLEELKSPEFAGLRAEPEFPELVGGD